VPVPDGASADCAASTWPAKASISLRATRSPSACAVRRRGQGARRRCVPVPSFAWCGSSRDRRPVVLRTGVLALILFLGIAYLPLRSRGIRSGRRQDRKTLAHCLLCLPVRPLAFLIRTFFCALIPLAALSALLCLTSALFSPRFIKGLLCNCRCWGAPFGCPSTR
jgi:hypothetical protein